METKNFEEASSQRPIERIVQQVFDIAGPALLAYYSLAERFFGEDTDMSQEMTIYQRETPLPDLNIDRRIDKSTH